MLDWFTFWPLGKEPFIDFLQEPGGGLLLFQCARIKFNWNCCIYCITQWQKLIFISGYYENHCDNQFCDSLRKLGPENCLWKSNTLRKFMIIFQHKPMSPHLRSEASISSLVIPMTTSCCTWTNRFLNTRHTADTKHGVTTLENLPVTWIGEGALGEGEMNPSAPSDTFPVNKIIL